MALAALGLVASACSEGPSLESLDAGSPAQTTSPTVAPPTATPEPTPTPEPTATPSPSPTPPPQRTCLSDAGAYAIRLSALEDSVAAALEGHGGTFGFALYDLECDAWAVVNPDHVQYTASTGKLPFVIAALRAVQEGRLDFTDLEPDLIEVLHHSSDDAANRIVARVTSDDAREVLSLAGVSDQTRFRDSWSNFNSTAIDLTRVWVALMRGELLDAEYTDLVLRLASEAVVDTAFETFYSDFDQPGLVFGQKVGHAVIFAPPYYLVGSGYLLDETGLTPGFAVTLVLNAPRLDDQRKDVFPLVLDFVADAVAELGPTS